VKPASNRSMSTSATARPAADRCQRPELENY
jgi:hypothetical protein